VTNDDHDDQVPPPALDTTAVTAGRRFFPESLAPVLFPSTAYQVPEVDDHRRMGATARPPLYYSRFGSPGVREFEDAVAELEGAEAALAFASGMAAVTSVVLGLCSSGDRLVATRQLFSVTSALFEMHLPRFGIDVELVDGTDADAIARACAAKPTQLLFVETPANPQLSLVDLDAVAAIRGPVKVVVSTFATPVVQQPLRHGVDLVLHSATKIIGGHSDLLLGAIVAADAPFHGRLRDRRHATGATPGVLEVYLALRGLRTLPTRYERAQSTARELAARLAEHAHVGRVRYPGSGTMISFETTGSGEDAEAVCGATRLIVHATSLGGVETTMERRARYPSERAVGTPDTLIRLSVGLEHPDDIWRDLDAALAVARA
jgi:cystathionine beta-lyase/cystathionine gamma-synthase